MFFCPILNHLLTNIIPQSIFSPTNIDLSFFGFFFKTLTFILPSHLITIFTYLLALPTN